MYQPPTTYYAPQGGAMYPPQQGGAMYPPQQGGAIYPPQQGGAMYPPQQGGAMYPPQPNVAVYQTPVQTMHPQPGEYHQQPGVIYPPQQVAAFPIQQPMMYQPQQAPGTYTAQGMYPPQSDGMYHQPPNGMNYQQQSGVTYPVPGGATPLYDGANWANKVAPMQPAHIADPNAGIQTDRWSIGLCGCCADCVPNCWMTTCCPCVSLAQVYARIGITTYTKALLRMGALSVPLAILRFISSQNTQSDHSDVRQIFVLFAIIFIETVFMFAVCYARLRVRRRFRIDGNCCDDLCVSWCCACCAIAQMATHSRSYKRGDCSFGGPDVLPPFVV